MAEVYNHKVVEKKWQKVWDDEKAFAATNDYSKPKYYALVEFPYPSGQGLLVGHPRPYTALHSFLSEVQMHPIPSDILLTGIVRLTQQIQSIISGPSGFS